MLKKKTMFRLMICIGMFAVLGVSSVQAEIGIQSILSSDGIVAVGTAVQSAVEAIYASTDDPAEIQQQLIDILNEAAATGDEQVVRYTIVAVMLAGGPENLDLSKQAIDNSDVFKNFPEVTAFTVSAADSMLAAASQRTAGGGAESGGGEKAGGASEEEGGGEKTGGTSEEEGGGEVQQGGGETSGGGYTGDASNPFGDGGDADIKDSDVPGTPV